MRKNEFHPGTIIGVIALVVGLVALFVGATGSTQSQGNWRCSQAGVVCSKAMEPSQWVSSFCAANQTGDMVCSVGNVNGQPTYLPLENVNTTVAASRVCTEYTCVEEVQVRPANYVLNLTTRNQTQ